MSDTVRILLLADTHMGLDLPLRPRTQRRRRGLDFLANMRRALEPALKGEADLVVHGGDLLDRGRVPMAVVEMALEPLLEVAQVGVPVFLVPGNHERARIPLHLWTAHPNLHIFREPCTFVLQVRDCRVALSGFPFDRQARTTFAQRMAEAGRIVDLGEASLNKTPLTRELRTSDTHARELQTGRLIRLFVRNLLTALIPFCACCACTRRWRVRRWGQGISHFAAERTWCAGAMCRRDSRRCCRGTSTAGRC